MPRKNILVFIDWYLPGYKAGGPIQSVANVVSHLSDDANLYIITSNKDYCETIPYSNIQSDTWLSISENVKVYYLSNNKQCKTIAKKSIQELAPDVIYINGVYSFYYSFIPLWVANRLKYSGKLIVAPRGMLATTAIAVKSFKKKLFLSLTNGFNSYKNVVFQASTNEEAIAIKQAIDSYRDVVVTPNLPKKTNSHYKEVITKQTGLLKLVSIARISPEKNILYGLQVLKNYTYNGSIEFDLYGPVYNEAYWQQCQDVIGQLPSNIKITYKGAIANEAIIKCIQQYHVLFLPTQGENFGHAIFESFIANRPVIISNKTPWQNLQSQYIGFDLDLTNPSSFAKAIQQLLDMNQDAFDSYVNASQVFVDEYYAKDAGLLLNKALFLS